MRHCVPPLVLQHESKNMVGTEMNFRVDVCSISMFMYKIFVRAPSVQDASGRNYHPQLEQVLEYESSPVRINMSCD